MFDIGWSEILVIAVVAIVVVGPKDLPPMLRAAGRMVSKLRKTAGEFQNQFNEALREAELDGVKDSINEIRGLNPMNEIRKSLDPVSAALKADPVMKPAPPPVVPSLGQPAQPMTDADLLPAADPLPVDREADAPAPRKRPAKSPAKTETATAEAGAEAPVAKKRTPRAKPPVATAEAEAPAAEAVPPARKPRAAKPKPSASAELPLPVPVAAPSAAEPAAPTAPVHDVAAAPPAASPLEERS